MKNLKDSVRNVIVASTISLLFVAPTMAQQEVSPDRFEPVAAQSQKVQKVQAPTPNSAKKHIAKVRQARAVGSQTASSKSASAYTQIARK